MRHEARGAGEADEVELSLSWPAVGVTAGGRVTYVDGDRVVARHAVDDRRASFMLVHGDVLAGYPPVRGSGLGARAAWASAPGTLLDLPTGSRLEGDQLTFEVPGGRLTRLGLYRPGEALPDDWRPGLGLLSNGTGFWTAEGHEIDPTTGASTRERSVPQALVDVSRPHVGDGLILAPDRSLLAPVTATTAGSPASTAGGLHLVAGLRDERGRLRALVTADGTPVEIPADRGGPLWVVDRPGGGRWLVWGDSPYDAETGQLLDESRGRAGTHPVSLLPGHAWHQVRVRDEAASRRLRAVTLEQGEELWQAINATLDVEGLDRDAMARALVVPGTPALRCAAQILGSDDETLGEAVVLAAFEAGATSLAWFLQLTPIAEAAEGETAAPEVTFPLRIASLGALRAMGADGGAHQVSRGALGDIAARLGLGGELDHEMTWWTDTPWWVLGRERALLALAASPSRTRVELESIAGLVGALHDHGLLGGRVRAGWVPDAVLDAPGGQTYVAGSVFGPHNDDRVDADHRALERCCKIKIHDENRCPQSLYFSCACSAGIASVLCIKYR